MIKSVESQKFYALFVATALLDENKVKLFTVIINVASRHVIAFRAERDTKVINRA